MKRYTIGKHTEVECEDGDWCKWEDVKILEEKIKDLKMLLRSEQDEKIDIFKRFEALKEEVFSR